MREERERETSSLSLSLSSKERTTIKPMREDGSLSECVSLLFFFVLPLSLSLSLGRAFYAVDDRNN